MSVELAPLSIRVLIVEPGAFRTENILTGPFYEDNTMPEYDKLRNGFKERLKQINGKQPGDPVKGMNALVDVVRGEGFAKGRAWPLYLPLGVEAEDAIRERYKAIDGVMVEWDPLIRNTRLDNP